MRSDKTLSYKYLLLLAGGWVVLMLMGAAETAEAGTSLAPERVAADRF